MGNETPKYFGPYLRANKNDKWHWVRGCPRFPSISSPEIRFSTSAPDPAELCMSCTDLEVQTKEKSTI